MQNNDAILDVLEMTEEHREALRKNHPIIERDYILPTPMLVAAYNIIRERVWARRTGVVFYGSQRVGKTKCAEEMKRLLQDEFPEVHVVVYSVRKGKSETHMFQLILEAHGHALASQTKSAMLFATALTDVELEVIKKKGRQFVFIIDEAQTLSEMDFQQLVAFHNALALKKIKMTTVSFAQPEILSRRSAFAATKSHQIIARFLSEPIQFEGLSSPAQFKDLLVMYDEETDYPEGSGWSYTRFFLPRAFANGFRLTTYSRLIWEKLQIAKGPAESSALPMEHVFVTIEDILQKSRARDYEGFILSDEDVDNAVRSANLDSFSQAMVLVPHS